MTKKTLFIHEADKAGMTAPTEMLKKTYFHSKSGHLYTVTGVIFDAERGRWMLRYKQVNTEGETFGVEFSHLPEDFNREGRFLEVKS